MKKTTIALLCFFLLPALSLPAQEGAFPSDPVAVDSVTLAQKKAASQAQKERISAYLSMTFPGRVTSVRVSDSKVRIRGRRPGGKNYFLAEITPWEDIDPQALGGELIPLRCRRFCRSVPRTVTRDGGTYDRSLSRWAVVEKTEGDGLALRSHARYADAVKPVRKATKMVLDGKKGLGGYGMNRNFYEDLDSLGIRSVTININLNGMVYSQERPGAIRKDFGGRTFWFDSSRVAYLDRVLSYCTERGVITSAITLIGLRSADPALTPVFRHPSCDGGFFTMPNMTSAEGVNAYAAVLDFLAERYSTGEHGRINNWIVHNEV
ncbi:MAG: hypothetical protein IK076_08915, partial [Bacteroidales bacterium]|nr:hypothetical protein [Bacteroidales bacterium]